MATNNILTQNDIQHVDYKDVDLLKNFINPHGRVIDRRKSGLTAKHRHGHRNGADNGVSFSGKF